MVTGTPAPGGGASQVGRLLPLLVFLRHHPFGLPCGRRLWDVRATMTHPDPPIGRPIAHPDEAACCPDGNQRCLLTVWLWHRLWCYSAFGARNSDPTKTDAARPPLVATVLACKRGTVFFGCRRPYRSRSTRGGPSGVSG